MPKPPGILVVTTNRWPSAGRLSLALRAAGFSVAVLCPADSPVHKIRNLEMRFRFSGRSPVASLEHAVAEASPGLIVCTLDDQAVRAPTSPPTTRHKRSRTIQRRVELMTLIERSLGNVASLEATFEKSDLTALAAELGLQIPSTTIVDNAAALESVLANMRFPIMVKADDAWGGRGVSMAHSADEVRAHVRALLLPTLWPWSVRRLFGPIAWATSRRWQARWPKKISLQHVILGRPANRAVACWQGKILAGASVVALKTAGAFGPATVINVIEQDDMSAATERIVAKLGLSGFIGFDFMRDDAGRAWLIEMNPRATPICHLRLPTGNLAALLGAQLGGAEPAIDVPVVHQDTIALFPGEMKHAERAHVDATWYHDVPWDEPEFIEACLQPDLREKVRGMLRGRTPQALPSSQPNAGLPTQTNAERIL